MIRFRHHDTQTYWLLRKEHWHQCGIVCKVNPNNNATKRQTKLDVSKVAESIVWLGRVSPILVQGGKLIKGPLEAETEQNSRLIFGVIYLPHWGEGIAYPQGTHWMPSQNPIQVGRWNWWKQLDDISLVPAKVLILHFFNSRSFER